MHDPKDGFSLLVLLPSARTKDVIPRTKTGLMLRMAVLPVRGPIIDPLKEKSLL